MVRSSRLHYVALIAGTALSLAACGKSDRGGETRPTGKKPDPAAVMALADSYTFLNPAGPIAAMTPVPGEGVPDAEAPKSITIARAVPKASPAPEGSVILARVHSDKSYKRLGIEAGDNYVWRDESDEDAKNWETYMVPADPKATPKKLKRDNTKYSHGEHTEPRLVRNLSKAGLTLGACLEDPVCPSGHCGYADVY